MAGWQKCCCDVDCLIFSDDFTRRLGDPDTPLGDRISAPFIGKGWCDNPGDYYIVNIPTWRVRCETPDAKAICYVKHPDEVGSMYVSILTQDEIDISPDNYEEGRKWRLYLNVTIEESGDPPVCVATSYFFAEFERFGPGDSWIRIGTGSGGTETILKQSAILSLTGWFRKFWAAVDEDVFCAGVDSSIFGSVFMPSPGLFNTDGWYSGFSMSEKDMLLDDFEFHRHYNSNPPKTRELNCPRCGLCLCEDNTEYYTNESIELPPVLNVCIWPDPYGCARLENLEPCCFEIEYDRIDATWKHEENQCCGQFLVRFTCPPYDIPGGVLANVGGCTESGEGFSSRESISHHCSSQTGEACYLFGPYFIADSDFVCGCRNTYLGTGACDYYITVSSDGCCSRKDCRDL